MGDIAGMLAAARADLGLAGRPNRITRDYAARHGVEFLDAPWCDMAITRWARQSGNAAAVLPGGDRAFTPWHAADFERAGRWHPGTTANVNDARPGDIVFFDWGGGNSIPAIDHVGVVEHLLGRGRLQTIEANTSDAVKRRVRDAGTIAGYGRPDYKQQEDDVQLDDMVPIGEYYKRLYGHPEYPFSFVMVSGMAESKLARQATGRIEAQLAKLAEASGVPVDVDEDAIIAGILAGLSPDAIADKLAAMLPDDIGEQVAEAFAARLAQRKP